MQLTQREIEYANTIGDDRPYEGSTVQLLVAPLLKMLDEHVDLIMNLQNQINELKGDSK